MHTNTGGSPLCYTSLVKQSGQATTPRNPLKTGGAVQSQLERSGSGLVTPESQHGDLAQTRQGIYAFTKRLITQCWLHDTNGQVQRRTSLLPGILRRRTLNGFAEGFQGRWQVKQNVNTSLNVTFQCPRNRNRAQCNQR